MQTEMNIRSKRVSEHAKIAQTKLSASADLLYIQKKTTGAKAGNLRNFMNVE